MSPARIIPTMRYHDARRMIAWLSAVLGFKMLALHEDDEGRVAHSQLALGSDMIMIGDVVENEFNEAQKTPRTLGGTTQSPYIIVEDADAIYRRSIENGATIVIDIKDEEYGGRGFTMRDPEGHLWSIGTYDPWNEIDH